MSGAGSITRWNRAGLARLRYLDANAATYLEELRLRLAQRFPEWEALQRPAPDGESAAARAERLRAQYLAPRAAVPDWGWELARALARACHILGEHVDAFANESYLATATQWESLRRLVELVDYHPAPPASAFTHLALRAKPGAAGRVPAGLAVAAAGAGARVVFETMEALDLSAALDALRPAGFDRDPRELAGDTLELEGPADGLAAGEPIVLEREPDGALWAHRIDEVIPGPDTTTVRVSPPLAAGALVRGTTVVHASPRDRLAALAPSKGTSTIGRDIWLVRSAAGIAIGDVVAIADAQHRSFHRVTAVSEPRLTLDRPVGELRFASASIAPVATVAVVEARSGPAGTFTVVVAGDWARLAQEVVADRRGFETTLPLRYRVTAATYTPITAGGGDAGRTVLRLEAGLDGAIPAGTAAPGSLLVPAGGSGHWERDRPLGIGGRDPITIALPRATTAGDLVVASMGSRLAWGAAASVARDELHARAAVHPVAEWQRTAGYLLLAATTVYGHFAKRRRLAGWQRNDTPLHGHELALALALHAAPAELAPGRTLIVYRPDAPDAAFATAVAAADGDRLRLRDPIPAGAGFTAGNLHVAGNVVLASHGERQPEKVLGSGDATQLGQRLVLAQPDVAFVPDAAQPRGVRADLDVIVEGRIWTQVGSLRDHGATAPVYTVRMTEAGALALQFGDGQHGRRLPTGRNNVRVRSRTGVGLAGNLPAGTLAKIARPHPLVESVAQPLPAVGGNDMERGDSLRRNAPATLHAMERCVSPSDFASLAAAHASIWQARAVVRPSAGTRAHRVEVVVVPANGAELGALAARLAAYLQQHALPNVEVTVTRFRPLPITLAVTVEIDTAAFDATAVVRDVRAALYDALSLRRRRLGQPVFLGDIYHVVENVPGVETSRCVLDGDPATNRILAVGGGVLYLDPERPSALGIAYEARP